jgi:Isocitrate/isopropylmalate dehydrogenase
MLDKMGLTTHSTKIKNAVYKTYEQGKFLTGDVGGKATTSDFVAAVIDNIE